MKKLLPALFFAALFLTFTACGSDDDEPNNKPVSQKIASVYQNETDVHYVFDINMDKDSSSIYLYNVVFTIGESTSPAMNIRIDAPVTVDNSGKVFTYRGTDIIPFRLSGTTPVPMPSFPVTNLNCVVNTSKKTFEMSFNCHGGSYQDQGALK